MRHFGGTPGISINTGTWAKTLSQQRCFLHFIIDGSQISFRNHHLDHSHSPQMGTTRALSRRNHQLPLGLRLTAASQWFAATAKLARQCACALRRAVSRASRDGIGLRGPVVVLAATAGDRAGAVRAVLRIRSVAYDGRRGRVAAGGMLANAARGGG
jgi:hypothetical protein